MDHPKIRVEVAYASIDEQKIIVLQVPMRSTLQTIINESLILNVFPEINLTQQKVGIFGKLKELSDVAKEGDRIEIYRPLLIDPKCARRNRSKKC